MSYLTLPSGISDFSKAVISFWFRVPQESLKAAMDQEAAFRAAEEAVSAAGGFIPPPLFNGVIPLLTFGRSELHKSVGSRNVGGYTYLYQNWTWAGGGICGWVDAGHGTLHGTFSQWFHDGKFDYQIDPSFIGITCATDPDTGVSSARLTLNLQMQDQATYAGSSLWVDTIGVDIEGDTWTIPHEPVVPGVDEGCEWPPYYIKDGRVWPVPIHTAHHITTVKSAAATVYGNSPENFKAIIGIDVVADQWHHVLLSFDLTNKCSTKGVVGAGFGEVSNAPQLWVSFNDKNIIGNNLYPHWPETGGDNDFITVSAGSMYRDVYSYTPAAPFDDGQGNMFTNATIGLERAVYDYTPSPVLGLPFGIPASADLVDKIRKVEMAEFQMWTDVTLNTASEHSRRAFIDFSTKKDPEYQRDPDTGEVLLDEETEQPIKSPLGMVPAPMKRAETLLKKKPEILLHGSKNWIAGKNTGSLGVDAQGKAIKSGQFIPTGEIKIWKPDPVLGETVGKPVDPS